MVPPTPAEIHFKVAFSNYLQFPLVPPAKLQKVAFFNYLRFPWFPQLNYQPNNIDIGTKILHFQCFVTTDMFLFCKPIFFSGNCRIYRDLAFGNIKTRFNAIFKKLGVSVNIYFFMNFCPRRATKLRRLYCIYIFNHILINLYVIFIFHFFIHIPAGDGFLKIQIQNLGAVAPKF